jgi:hypothetical protein
VLDETRGVIGEAFGRPFARVAHQVRWLGRFLWAHGPALLAAGVGGAVALGARFARAWRVILVVPALYAFYLVTKAPWIRMQETLVFLPFLACACAGGYAWLERHAVSSATSGGDRSAVADVPRGRPRHPLAAVALGGVLCALMFQQSLWRSSLFTRRDTRHFAQDWLQRSLPRGRVVGLEVYTKARPGQRVPVREIRALYKVEQEGLAAVRAEGCDYVLRNATMSGRGSVDPFTGRRYERLQRNLDAFLSETRRLAVWSPAPALGEVDFAFVNSTFELYALRPVPKPLAQLTVPLVSPLFLEPGEDAYCFPVGAGLGADLGLDVSTEPRRFRVGGPPFPRDVHVVLWSESGMRVRVNGLGVSRRVELTPGTAVSEHLKPSPWLPQTHAFRPIEIAPAREQPAGRRCMARICFDEAVAAAMVEEGGAAATRATDDALARALELPPDEYTVNGINAGDYNELARLYLSERDGEVVVPLRAPDGPGLPHHSGKVEFPVWLPRGTWHLRTQLRLSSVDPKQTGSIALRVRDHQGNTLCDLESPSAEADQWKDLDLELAVSRAGRLLLDFGGPAGACVRLRNPELYWTLADRLR